jgi:2-polyprenyl-3-methyl-5-hydroxy-6-metoxy-1,4-benzoquinol methylase
MTTNPTAAVTREERERKAWNDDRVFERCDAWVHRVIHVLEGANTLEGEERFTRMIAAGARGASILDVGCGVGGVTVDLLRHEPAHILAIDISSEMIDVARASTSDERLEFRVQSTSEPLAERFDLVTGRAILHHIDFRELLARLYRDNLRPGGRMLFMEPMWHPLAAAFHRLVRSAHSPDERLVARADVAWLHAQFPQVELYGINLLSFPAGVLSSLLFSSADNRLMRAAGRLDGWMLERSASLVTYSRQAIIAIDKPKRP